MLTVHVLAILAAQARTEKQAMTTHRARAGRTCKGKQMSKQLHAAGSARQNVPGVLSYPRGRNV